MNNGTSRREFLGTLAAFSVFPLEQEKPDLILYNGNILTVNDKEPRAQAVATARELLADAIKSGVDLGFDAVVIADERGEEIASVQLAEVLPKRLR